MADLRFVGRAAVVTGAASGIGRAIADALLAEGAQVIGLDKDWGTQRSGFEAAGGTTEAADLTRTDGRSLGAELLTRYGPIELIVNNVGVTTTDTFLSLDEDAYDRVMQTNLRTPWFMTRALVDTLIEKELPGSIVFISSLHSRFTRHFPHYSASKAGVVALTRELAHELARHHIRVNAVSPGWIDTGRLSAASRVAAERVIPCGRVGLSRDIAPIVLSLLDDSTAGYVTGADVPVDGGLALHSWLDDVEGGPERTAMAPTPVSAPGYPEVPETHVSPTTDRVDAAGWLVLDALEKTSAAGRNLTIEAVEEEVAKSDPAFEFRRLGFPSFEALLRYALEGSSFTLEGSRISRRR